MPTNERLVAALADRYRIERELGVGGMATVYLAEDLKHDRKVAIKVLKPELAAVLGAERFVQEIKTTAALSHPHILPLFDSGEAGGFLYYVMPFIEGETIREKLNRETQFGIEEAVRITTEVADALDYAHRHGVIHRDIKPENLLLHDGRAMVMDFGIALAVSAAAGGRMTETGLSLGTPHYMSPEQATAEKDITARSDIYSLASVLYEMLAGVPPHEGGSAQQTIMRIITDTPRAVTELRKTVPPNVAAALGKALEKLPADRFDTAKAFADALSNTTFTTATAAIGVGVLPGHARRWRAVAVIAAAAAVVFAVIGAWGWVRPVPKPVSRYRVAFPDSQALTVFEGPQMAWAPDGSWMVYAGAGPADGTPQLWVKARDRADAVPLAGALGWSPSVSVDGRRVAFARGNAKYAMPVGGGPARKIADDGWPNGGGVWLDDGSFVYLDVASQLRRVDGAAGPSRVVYTPPAGVGAVPIDGLPSNRGILFLTCSFNCNPTSDLWVFDERRREARQLLPDVSWAKYIDGLLLYAQRTGDVYAVSFDLDALAPSGASVPLFSGVRVDNTAEISLSRSGALAYLAGAGGSVRSEAVWISRDGTTTPVDSSWSFVPSSIAGFALSPDGSRLAIGLSAEGNSDIWIKDLDREGSPSRLTFDASIDGRPRWTPDGQSVVFLSSRRDTDTATVDYDLYARRADGTGADSLWLDLPEQIEDAQESRDGRWLVMRIGTGTTSKDIVAMRPGQDSVPRPLLTNPKYDELMPALSPDGRLLAYVSNETGRQEVFVQPFPEVNSGKWQVSLNGGVSPVWAHSGRELFFVTGNLNVVSQVVRPGASFDRGEQRTLFHLDAARMRLDPYYPMFDVSPDDRRFLFVRTAAESAAVSETPALIVVENWLQEVKAKVRR